MEDETQSELEDLVEAAKDLVVDLAYVRGDATWGLIGGDDAEEKLTTVVVLVELGQAILEELLEDAKNKDRADGFPRAPEAQANLGNR